MDYIIILIGYTISTCANKTTGENQCWFRRNRSTIDHIISIRKIIEKKQEYNDEVFQLFIDFDKTCNTIKIEPLYDILLIWFTDISDIYVKSVIFREIETNSDISDVF